MNIYSILQLCGGLAFFLFGMHVMSGSLEKLAGGNLQKILKEVTSNPVKSLFFGAIVTIAIQSSSALTVMLVGLVNSGIMELEEIIYGSPRLLVSSWVPTSEPLSPHGFLVFQVSKVTICSSRC